MEMRHGGRPGQALVGDLPANHPGRRIQRQLGIAFAVGVVARHAVGAAQMRGIAFLGAGGHLGAHVGAADQQRRRGNTDE